MFKYRPDGTDPDEFWADNWASNALAYLSQKFVPSWCKSEDHWTMWFMDLLYASCSCCLSFRFFIFGGLVGGLVGLVLGAAVGLHF